MTNHFNSVNERSLLLALLLSASMSAQAETLDALIHALTEGLRASYDVEYVSLVLTDADHDIRHLLMANGTPAENFEHLLIVEAMTALVLADHWLRQLALSSAADRIEGNPD